MQPFFLSNLWLKMLCVYLQDNESGMKVFLILTLNMVYEPREVFSQGSVFNPTLHLYCHPQPLPVCAANPCPGPYSRWSRALGFGTSPSSVRLTVGSLSAQKYTAESLSCEAEIVKCDRFACFLEIQWQRPSAAFSLP